MKYLKIMGLCLVAAFALSAVVANSAFAVTEPYVESTGGGRALEGEGGEGELETTAGEKVRCEKTVAKAELETEEGEKGKRIKDILPIFRGCTAKILTKEYECQSGTTKKEIVGFDLLGRLGYINKAEKKVGLLLNPETGRANNPNNLFAEFECSRTGETIRVKVKGSIIGLITPINTLVEPGGATEFFLLDFSKGTGKGENLDKKFEGEAENVLETESTTSKKFIGSAIGGSIKLFPAKSAKIIA